MRRSDFREGIPGTTGTAVNAGGVHRRHERGVRSDDDDGRAGLQIFEAAVHQVEHTDQIDVDGIGEGLWRQAGGQRADAGVGDDYVQMAEFGDTVVNRGAQARAVANIDDYRDDPL